MNLSICFCNGLLKAPICKNELSCAVVVLELTSERSIRLPAQANPNPVNGPDQACTKSFY
jgi:hypothetical protein